MRERPCRDKAFLDAPEDYDEFSILIQRQGLQHRLRLALHRNRTVALIVLAACSAKLSGAALPPFPYCGEFNWEYGGAGNNTIGDWGVFLVDSLALDLLARHFKGAASALACMFIMIASSILVYPIHRLSPVAASRMGRASFAPFVNVFAVALPSILVWGVAVWGAGHFRWGLASGLTVGLLSACLSLKTASFVNECVPLAAITRDAASEHATATATHPATADLTAQENDDHHHHLTFAEFMFFLLASPSLVCEPRFLRIGARRPPRVSRAVSEFLHAGMVFLALHAACSALFVPALRVIAAASTVKQSTGYTGEVELDESNWVDYAGWAAVRANGSGAWLSALLPRSGEIQDLEGNSGSITTGGLETMAAVALGLGLFSPAVHFTTFYGFWHCVCVGCAEMWGYPDRNFYGPWWLLMDDPRAMFRLWSTPVHRWLSSCIYRPIMANERIRPWNNRDSDTASFALSVFKTVVVDSHNCGHGGQEGGRADGHIASEKNGGPRAAGFPGRCSVTSGRNCGKNGVSNGSSTIVLTRDRCSNGNKNQQHQEQDQQQHHHHHQRHQWRGLLALSCVFVFSSLVHEAVTFVAMRWTCWPFNSFCLVTGITVIASWDNMYPVRGLIMAKGAIYRPPAETTASTVAVRVSTAPVVGVCCSHRDEMNTSKSDGVEKAVGGVGGTSAAESVFNPGTGKKLGSEWRGWGAVAFFQGTSAPITLMVDFLAWQWWRHTLLNE